MKKRIFAAVLAVSVMLSMIAFASCNGNGEPDDLGERIGITATVRIVGDNNYVLIDNLDVTLEDYASRLTIMALTRRALDAAEISYTATETGFTAIGPYSVDLEYRVDVYDDEDEDEGEPEENGENGGNGEAEDHADLIWVVMLDGREVPGTTVLTGGETIEWNFTDSGW